MLWGAVDDSARPWPSPPSTDRESQEPLVTYWPDGVTSRPKGRVAPIETTVNVVDKHINLADIRGASGTKLPVRCAHPYQKEGR